MGWMTSSDQTPATPAQPEPAQQPPAQQPAATPPKPQDAAPRPKLPPEIGGPTGPEPTRFGDWERKGRVSDF